MSLVWFILMSNVFLSSVGYVIIYSGVDHHWHGFPSLQICGQYRMKPFHGCSLLLSTLGDRRVNWFWYVEISIVPSMISKEKSVQESQTTVPFNDRSHGFASFQVILYQLIDQEGILISKYGVATWVNLNPDNVNWFSTTNTSPVIESLLELIQLRYQRSGVLYSLST